MAFVFPIYVVVGVTFIFLLRKVRDNYYIQREFFAAVLLLPIGLGFYFVLSYLLDSELEQLSNIPFLLTFDAIFIFSTVIPIYLTYQQQKKFKRERSLLKEWTDSKSSGSGKEEEEKTIPTFQEIMKLESPYLEDFKQFLAKEFCVENVIFWLTVESFSTAADDSQVSQEGLDIMKQFILPSSPLQVNIPSDISSKLIQQMEENQFSRSMFQSAQKRYSSFYSLHDM